MFTFDDAYADCATYAFPVLERFGFQSVVFVISGQVLGLTSWDGLPMMTIEQIRYWDAHGVEIGAHTRTHCDLTAASDQVVEDEVTGSKEELIRAGLRPLSFAYPYGSLDERGRKSVQGVFPIAFTCEEGLNDLCTDPLLLKRTMVQPGDSLLDIEFRVTFARTHWIGSVHVFACDHD
jgi:peptidoglycan/xylan/chitin deacetylase (PgdA/CDA1 family)